MKLIRVPWIRCRADEVGARPWEMEWRHRHFAVLAENEAEANQWWRGLSDSERNTALGLEEPSDSAQTSLF